MCKQKQKQSVCLERQKLLFNSKEKKKTFKTASDIAFLHACIKVLSGTMLLRGWKLTLVPLPSGDYKLSATESQRCMEVHQTHKNTDSHRNTKETLRLNWQSTKTLSEANLCLIWQAVNSQCAAATIVRACARVCMCACADKTAAIAEHKHKGHQSKRLDKLARKLTHIYIRIW